MSLTPSPSFVISPKTNDGKTTYGLCILAVSVLASVSIVKFLMGITLFLLEKKDSKFAILSANAKEENVGETTLGSFSTGSLN